MKTVPAGNSSMKLGLSTVLKRTNDMVKAKKLKHGKGYHFSKHGLSCWIKWWNVKHLVCFAS